MLSVEQLVEQHPERVDVGGGGDCAALELLRRGVLGGQRARAVGHRAADRDAGGLIDERRDPEVEELRAAGAVDEMFEGLRSRCTTRLEWA